MIIKSREGLNGIFDCIKNKLPSIKLTKRIPKI